MGKKHQPEEIIGKLREAEILLAQGSTVADACRRIGVTEQSYYRWRKEYGGVSYFGGHRKGKRGRGAVGKVPVFGLLKRHGKVYVAIIANARSDTLIPIIRRGSDPTAWSIPMPLAATMCSMSPSSTTCGPTTPSCSPISATTSRNREFLEPGQTPPEELYWHPETALPPIHQNVRMALQLPPHPAYAANPDTMVVQVIQVTLSMSAPFSFPFNNIDFESLGRDSPQKSKFYHEINPQPIEPAAIEKP